VTPSRGYTLIEVLIAVTVFGVLTASAYVALDGLSRAALEHRQRSEELAALQLAIARFDADIRQLVTRPVRSLDGRDEPALIGHRQSLTATRAGWANPSDLSRSNLQRFSWQYDGTEWMRLDWPVTDAAAGTRPWIDGMLDGLQRLRLRYRDGSGAWHDQWPPARATEATQSLPAAIELEIDSRRFGAIRRLLVMAP
jgi:general secretion pathway protein J